MFLGRRGGLRQGRPEGTPGLLQPGLMVKSVARKGEVLLCGTCMDARGLGDGDMVEGARRSTMDELADCTLAADRVLVF